MIDTLGRIQSEGEAWDKVLEVLARTRGVTQCELQSRIAEWGIAALNQFQKEWEANHENVKRD